MEHSLHNIRKQYYPKLHSIKNPLGDIIGTNLYSMYAMYKREYICSMDLTISEGYELMKKLGFSYEPIAALKIWEPNKSVELGSFVKREGGRDPYQLHVHIFEGNDGEMIFAGHYEYSWITHPKKHYRGNKMEFDTAEKMFKNILEENDYQWH